MHLLRECSVSHTADVNGYIISTFDLSHKGCSGSAKPTQRQIASLEVVKAAVSANGALPAKQLIDQTKALSGLECSRRMAYRARDVIVESCNGDYLIGFQRMESLLQLFCEKNSGSTFDVQFDSDNRFQRAFLSHPYAGLHFKYGQQIVGVDGTFMKHGLYDSTMLLLVGRTGNNNNVTIAVGLCNSENGQNCAWFIQHCITSGLSQLSIPVFIDRGTSLISALEGAQFLNIFYCTRHILGNVKSIFRGLVTSDIERLVWALQASESEEEYEARLVALGVTHPTIADYLKSIPVERWVLYCNLSKTKLYGWRTTNFVESQNRAALEIRQQHPFTVFNETMERWMVDRFKCDQDVDHGRQKAIKLLHTRLHYLRSKKLLPVIIVWLQAILTLRLLSILDMHPHPGDASMLMLKFAPVRLWASTASNVVIL